jgi:hypothetical protein
MDMPARHIHGLPLPLRFSPWSHPWRSTRVPANLSPECKAAEAAYCQARDPRERLDGLREMLRAIPKHQETDTFRRTPTTASRSFRKRSSRQVAAGTRPTRRGR